MTGTMTTLRHHHAPRAAHPWLDLLERTGGLPLVAAAVGLASGLAVVMRALV
ncbi:hypothetical protein [Aeromicrobium endophyticum]|uniref:hypothetical protein n=1 Tax=Aeromicrobium endophyticum TaxID=2292704 RepID=UPI001314BE07|nr:hypothetical protein [Aeromicrobium endophyticum]